MILENGIYDFWPLYNGIALHQTDDEAKWFPFNSVQMRYISLNNEDKHWLCPLMGKLVTQYSSIVVMSSKIEHIKVQPKWLSLASDIVRRIFLERFG